MAVSKTGVVAQILLHADTHDAYQAWSAAMTDKYGPGKEMDASSIVWEKSDGSYALLVKAGGTVLGFNGALIKKDAEAFDREREKGRKF